MTRGRPAFVYTAVAKKISGLTSSNFGTRDSSNNNNIVALPNNGRIFSERTRRTSERGALSGSSVTLSATVVLVKRRCTAKQVHPEMVKKNHKTSVAENAYLAATQKIVNHPNRKSNIANIISNINKLYNTLLNLRTVCQRIQTGLDKVLPKRGHKHVLPAPIEATLVDAISLFISLACAKQQKTPTRKELINITSSGLRDSPTPLCNDEVFYKKLYHRFSADIAIVSGTSSIKHRQALYTTCNNLYIWFNILKEFLISKGFARKRSDDEDGGGELIFSGQLSWTRKISTKIVSNLYHLTEKVPNLA